MGVLLTNSSLPSTILAGIITGSVMVTRNFATTESRNCGNHERIALPNMSICNALARATIKYIKNSNEKILSDINNQAASHNAK